MFKSIAFLFLGLTMCSTHNPARQTGILEGKVSIGPLRPGPVKVDDPEPKVPPGIFASHKIVILSRDQSTKIQEITIDSKGNYSAEVPAGSYLIDFTPHDYGLPGSNPPKPVTIEAGKTTHLDIDIDTGIR